MRSTIAFLILFATNASASLYSAPIGHREAYLASSGVALENSPGNLVLNPAGLTFLKDKKINLTISGSAAGFQQVRADTFDNTSDNMAYRTLLASGIFPTEEFQGYFALYYMNPLDESTAAHSEFTNGSDLIKKNHEIDTTSVVGGIAAGYAPNDELGFGLSASLGFDIRDINETLTSQSPALTSLQYARTQIKYYYLQLTPGVLWRPHPRWNVGVTLQWRPFALFNDGNTYITQQSSQGMDLSEQVLNFDPAIRDDIATSIGQKFLIGDRDMLLVDLSYNPRFSYKNQKGEESVIANFKSLSLGWQRKLFEQMDVLLGYGAYDTNVSKTYLVTGGFAINRETHHMILGLYYKNIADKEAGIGQVINGGFMFSSDVAY